MIKKTYHSSVNCTNPKTYFEKFYTHCWYNIAGLDHLDKNAVICGIIREELLKYGAAMTWHFNARLYSVKFVNDEDYTVFKLRWL